MAPSTSSAPAGVPGPSASSATPVDNHEHEHDEPHMPSPSLSPIILALGMTALVFGLVFGPIVSVIGALGTVAGLGTWLYDEIKNAGVEQH